MSTGCRTVMTPSKSLHVFRYVRSDLWNRVDGGIILDYVYGYRM